MDMQQEIAFGGGVQIKARVREIIEYVTKSPHIVNHV
jgi:hypothetical protein